MEPGIVAEPLRRALGENGSLPADPYGSLPYCGLGDEGCNGRSPSCECVDYLLECDPTSGTCQVDFEVAVLVALIVGAVLCMCCCCRKTAVWCQAKGYDFFRICLSALAVVGIGLFVGGLYLLRVTEMREVLVRQYNGWVQEWSTVYEKEFSRATFVLEMGLAVPNASVHHYTLTADRGLVGQSMVSWLYSPDLQEYQPLQYISSQILAAAVATSSNKIQPLPHGQDPMQAEINVSVVATTEADPLSKNKTIMVQKLHVGAFQMIGEWPAPARACGLPGDEGHDDDAHEVNGACEVLRAVSSLCLVVSWRGAEEGWAFRSGANGKGCYQNDPKHGYGGWVLATTEEWNINTTRGDFVFEVGVFEEHDPVLMIQTDGMIDMLMSSPRSDMLACFVAEGVVLVTSCVLATARYEYYKRSRGDAPATTGVGSDDLVAPLFPSINHGINGTENPGDGTAT